MAKERHTIPMMPLTGGLMNAGGQATIPENRFWEARNVDIGPDGRLTKRPGLRRWGQQIKAPAAGGVGWNEIFTSSSDFNVVNATPASSTVTIAAGKVTFETLTTGAGGAQASIERNPQPNDGSPAAGEDAQATFRFMFRAPDVLPTIGSTVAWNGFGGGFENNLGISLGFLIAAAGIYIQTGGTFTLVAGTDIDDGNWHIVEIQMSSTTGLATVIIDEVTITSTAPFTDSAIFDPGAYQAILGVQLNPNDTLLVEIALMQLRSGIDGASLDAMTGVPITAIFQWNSPDPLVEHLLIVAGDTVYEDRDWSNVFTPVARTSEGALTTFAPFQENLLIVNPLVPTTLWTGDAGDAPDTVPTAMPDEVYIATQHQGRAVIVTDSKPLTVYVGAANTLEDWTTEDEVSPSGESFFFFIPDALGERVTFLLGDFYGELIIGTHNSVYSLVGSSIDTYTLRRISARIGIEGPRAGALSGNDIVFQSHHGVHNLRTIQEYGDISTFFLSKDLRALWQRDSFVDLPKILTNYRASTVHAAQLGKTYFAVQTQEDPIPTRLFELNHDNNAWAGPWTVDCEAVQFVLLGNPPVAVLMLGDSVGRVSLAVEDPKEDFGADAYTFKVRSARIDGRSLDPSLTRRTKLWRALRIFILPRGDWDLTVSWLVDGHIRGDETLHSQNVYNDALLDTTFILNASSTIPAEKVGVITVPLDVRGRWMEFTIEQAEAGEDAVIVGIEVDLIVAQEDKEN